MRRPLSFGHSGVLLADGGCCCRALIPLRQSAHALRHGAHGDAALRDGLRRPQPRRQRRGSTRRRRAALQPSLAADGQIAAARAANLHQIWPAQTAAQTARPHQQRAAMTELPPVGASRHACKARRRCQRRCGFLYSPRRRRTCRAARSRACCSRRRRQRERAPATPTSLAARNRNRGGRHGLHGPRASVWSSSCATSAATRRTTSSIRQAFWSRRPSHRLRTRPRRLDTAKGPLPPRRPGDVRPANHAAQEEAAQLPPTFSGRFPRRLDAKLNELRDDPEAFAAFEQHISLLMKEMARAQAAARPPPRKKEKTKKKEAAPEPPAEPEQPVPELATEPLPEPEAPRPGSAPRPDTAPAWDGPAASERPSSATPRKPKKAVRLVEQAAAATTAENPSGPSAAFYDTPEFSPPQQSSSQPKAQEKKKPKEKKKGAGEDNAARREYLKEVKGSSGKEESSEEAAGDASGAANPFLPVLPVGKPRVRRKALAGMLSKML